MKEKTILPQVVEHIKGLYGAEPEYLWARTPNCAALRHGDSGKWFGALMLDLPRQRLGLSEDGCVDVLNLKCDPRMIGSLMDGKRILRGCHMNKEHWISVLLDGSVPLEELAPLIELSWQLTLRVKKAKRTEKK